MQAGRLVVWNSTDWAGAADLAMHQAAYVLACLCLTVALILCFLVALFVLSLLMEMLGQSVYALCGGREARKRVEQGRI